MTSRFHPPQQSRSQETLHRILDATEQVLETKSFSEATLAEIVERAGVTVGAFYRRFPDKDALLHHLDERCFEELYGLADALLDPVRWQGAPLSAILQQIAEAAVELYRRRCGLLRSLFLRARTDRVIQDSARRVNAHIVERLQALAQPRRDEIAHPDPALAIALGYTMFLAALREITLFPEAWTHPYQGSDAELARELTRLYLGYLGVPAAGGVAR